MGAAAQHPHIRLLTYCELEQVEGYIGNFEVAIRQKARYVDHQKCTGCGICWEKCPSRVRGQYDQGMGTRKAIYIDFPQAVPNKPVIDAEHCRKLTAGKCGLCQKLCPAGAIDFEQQDHIFTEQVGAIVVASGFDLIAWQSIYGEYGYGKYPDVISGLQFERMSNSSGPTGGKIQRPSDGKEPKNVVFIKCVGSRDEAKGKEYCSRTCCMYTAKHAMQVLEKIPGAQSFVFYMDVRTPGKNYEEFYRRAVNEGAQYIRGRVSKIYPRGDKLMVDGADTLLGVPVEVEADLVVLATAMVPSQKSNELAKVLSIATDKDGFFQEAHPKLRPVETSTAGIFLAGSCQGPKDIPDTVAQAGGAAAKVCALMSQDQLSMEPLVARVNENLCTGCMTCKRVCPYHAIELKTTAPRPGSRAAERIVAAVNKGLCQGCGACGASCRCGAIDVQGFTDVQISAEIDMLCR